MKMTTLKERPEFYDALKKLNGSAWPEFLLNWDCPNWSELFTTFAGYQPLVLDEEENLIAFGDTVPLVWNDEFMFFPDDLEIGVNLAVQHNEAGMKPNLLLALAVVVSEERRGEGLSSAVLGSMKDLARKNEIADLLVPVRPTLKTKYPLAKIEDYALWKREDGLPFDPWLRVHERLGAEFLKTAEVSLTVSGSVSDWESWTKMKFPQSGRYTVDGALNPISIDCEKNTGIYDDPCIWVRYSVRP